MVGAITIFIQVTAEELLYRGYAMQFMRRLTANPVLIVGISGLAFAAINWLITRREKKEALQATPQPVLQD